ncbi:MAG: rhodanese-like protein [Candidatus Peregrinibacteria bacterium GW2011_GWE2_39_6]|nr:MAG: rhodanese-like protein [Candidatus Peregrinibacteria bacterium GW2011_GWF2_39_17]KKR25544.1 MAG: rhodanese-like protein [Candidatus Peregrinibacteria bacterium GW2011_GWE2_39_6]HCW32635.1 hypothetical protein [Candidatus Peregrinibacteria bacterium]
MFNTIHHNEIKAMIDRNDDFVIVDVRAPALFMKNHLPGAINIPLNSINFTEMVDNQIPDKSKPIVIYCADHDCQKSVKFCKKLANLGYRHISDYENGLQEWINLGYPLNE